MDNDLDGFVDEAPDGRALTQSCALTLGVCAPAVGVCVDGRWSACSYGPDYQRTETRCDGLDNDCDGTIDSSWIRQLLDADAGTIAGPLVDADIESTWRVPDAPGHWLALPNDLLILDDDLAVVRRHTFPILLNGHAYVFPHGAGYLRVAHEYPVTNNPARTLFQPLDATGTPAPSTDGGVVAIAEVQWPGPRKWASFAARPSDAGWLAVVAGDEQHGLWAQVAFDGGVDRGALDAGPLGRGLARVYQQASTMVIARWSFTASQLEVFDLDPSSGELRPRVAVSGSCGVASVSPLTVSCWNGALTDWTFETGGRVVPAFADGPVWTDTGGLPLLAWTQRVGWDGGLDSNGIELAAVQDGGLVRMTTLPDYRRSYSLRAHPLGGRLLLFTWSNQVLQGTCPACLIDGFYARYACLPP